LSENAASGSSSVSGNALGSAELSALTSQLATFDTRASHRWFDTQMKDLEAAQTAEELKWVKIFIAADLASESETIRWRLVLHRFFFKANALNELLEKALRSSEGFRGLKGISWAEVASASEVSILFFFSQKRR
jgi:hypothetical protein